MCFNRGKKKDIAIKLKNIKKSIQIKSGRL